MQVRWAGLKHTDATIVILLKYLNVFYFLTGPDFQYICESLLSSPFKGDLFEYVRHFFDFLTTFPLVLSTKRQRECIC